MVLGEMAGQTARWGLLLTNDLQPASRKAGCSSFGLGAGEQFVRLCPYGKALAAFIFR